MKRSFALVSVALAYETSPHAEESLITLRRHAQTSTCMRDVLEPILNTQLVTRDGHSELSTCHLMTDDAV